MNRQNRWRGLPRGTGLIVGCIIIATSLIRGQTQSTPKSAKYKVEVPEQMSWGLARTMDGLAFSPGLKADKCDTAPYLSSTNYYREYGWDQNTNWIRLEASSDAMSSSNLVVMSLKEPIVTQSNGVWTIRFPESIPPTAHAITMGEATDLGWALFRQGATLAATLRNRNPDLDDVPMLVRKSEEAFRKQNAR